MKLDLKTKLIPLTLLLSLLQLNCHSGDLSDSSMNDNEPCLTDESALPPADDSSNTVPSVEDDSPGNNSDDLDSTIDSDDGNSPTDDLAPEPDGDDSSEDNETGGQDLNDSDSNEPDFLPTPDGDFGEAGDLSLKQYTTQDPMVVFISIIHRHSEKTDSSIPS